MIRDLQGQDLLVASGNAGKLAEFSALFKPFGTRVLSLKDLGLSEPEETEFTFVGNARLKARSAVAVSGLPSLADDSGLTVDILGGWPGIYTADWAETADGRDFDIAMQKTWDLLQAMHGKPPYLAAFHCILVLSFPSGPDLVFNGKLLGQIVWPKRGSLGHGYDPIFQPDGYQKTMGEMSALEKNRISHRAKAVQSFADHCFT
jgi:XTP/dITP diphosphohydrolase